MSLWRYCCFWKSGKVADQTPNQTQTPKQVLLQFQNWVMDLKMGKRPCRLSIREIEYLSRLKGDMRQVCEIVRIKYGTVKVNEYMREWVLIHTEYVELLRQKYLMNELEVNSDLLKTPAVRTLLGLSVRWA